MLVAFWLLSNEFHILPTSCVKKGFQWAGFALVGIVWLSSSGPWVLNPRKQENQCYPLQIIYPLSFITSCLLCFLIKVNPVFSAIMLKVSHALDHFCHHSPTQHRLAHPLNLYCGLFSTELQNKSLLIPFLAHTQSCLLCSLPAEHPNPSLVACPVFSPTCSSSCRCSAFSHFHLYQNSLWSHPRGSGPCHHLSWASWPGLAPICLLPHPLSELRDCPQYSHLHLGVQRTANKPLLVMKALSLVLFIACLGAFSLLSKQVLIANPIFAQKKCPLFGKEGQSFSFSSYYPWLLLPT